MRATVAALLLCGCTCERDIWDGYLWIEIVGLPATTTSAALTVTTRGEDRVCAVDFVASTEDFADEVLTDCADAADTGTYNREWWVQLEATRIARDLEVALSYEAGGAAQGFASTPFEAEWDRSRDDGTLCTSLVGQLYLTPDGAETRLP